MEGNYMSTKIVNAYMLWSNSSTSYRYTHIHAKQHKVNS